ncbi:transposase [Streptomyces sp. NBC_00624]|uniref:transposase n=1 Tax=Streptomyces sp. NBC_00624 TaxID=2975791 RepID=UPI00386A349A
MQYKPAATAWCHNSLTPWSCRPPPAVHKPGIGPLLDAEFLAGGGSDLTFFATRDRLAAIVGLTPAPRDSDKKSGNLHRPRVNVL